VNLYYSTVTANVSTLRKQSNLNSDKNLNSTLATFSMLGTVEPELSLNTELLVKSKVS